jgi:hypothetical protein
MFFHDKPMLKNVSVIIGKRVLFLQYRNISFFMCNLSTLPVRMIISSMFSFFVSISQIKTYLPFIGTCFRAILFSFCKSRDSSYFFTTRLTGFFNFFALVPCGTTDTSYIPTYNRTIFFPVYFAWGCYNLFATDKAMFYYTFMLRQTATLIRTILPAFATGVKFVRTLCAFCNHVFLQIKKAVFGGLSKTVKFLHLLTAKVYTINPFSISEYSIAYLT